MNFNITFKKKFLVFLWLGFSLSLFSQVRRDLNALTAAERTTLVNLMQQYITAGVVEDHCNYQARTGDNTLDIHGDVHFLPFHRAYIEGMEDFLVSQGYPQFVPLPSWNPANAVPNEFRVVDANCATASVNCRTNVTNTPSTDCSTSINWAPNRARPRYLSRPVQTGTGNDLCDWPFATGSGGLSRIMEGETPNSANSTYHNSVHTSMGGAMRYFTSPGAPIFFCWHAYLDDIWKEYQCGCSNGGGKTIDLYMKDTPKIPNNERDGGNEPNIDNGSMFVSADIWVRNQNDGLSNSTNQNPIYSKTNYVYIRVRNRGCQPSTGNEQLVLHWAKEATALTWPSFWNGSTSAPVMGNVVSTLSVPVIAPGSSTVVMVQWMPPNPADYNGNTSPSLFALLARIVASNDPMTTAEGSTIATNIRNNNNIIAKDVTVDVPPNTPPTVNISSPALNATFDEASDITIEVNATDADGNVDKVEFYQGTTLLATVTTSPYSFNWTAVPTGIYNLTAKATDNQGSVTTSSVVRIVVGNPPNALPTVSITSPANGASFIAPATIAIAANASDADGSIDRVEFYQGTTLLGTDNTSPYSYTWSNAAAGNYSLTAVAYDDLGAMSTSPEVAIAVNTVNTPPTVSITSPANNASFPRPANITINANAADANGTITKVEFFQGTTLLGTDNTSPYSFTWTNVQAATYSLTAKAYDNNGAVTTSAIVRITVTGNNPPTVAITSPANGAIIATPANITISATASDLGGSVSRVAFYRGSTLISTDYSSPYSAVWNNAPVGTYTLTARAYDNQGVTTTSAPVVITVRNQAAPPITNGGNLSSTNQLLEAEASVIAHPSDAKVNIAFATLQEGTVDLSLFDEAGTEVFYSKKSVGKGKQSLEVETGVLPAGLYTYKLKFGPEFITGPVVK